MFEVEGEAAARLLKLSLRVSSPKEQTGTVALRLVVVSRVAFCSLQGVAC